MTRSMWLVWLKTGLDLVALILFCSSLAPPSVRRLAVLCVRVHVYLRTCVYTLTLPSVFSLLYKTVHLAPVLVSRCVKAKRLGWTRALSRDRHFPLKSGSFQFFTTSATIEYIYVPRLQNVHKTRRSKPSRHSYFLSNHIHVTSLRPNI